MNTVDKSVVSSAYMMPTLSLAYNWNSWHNLFQISSDELHAQTEHDRLKQTALFHSGPFCQLIIDDDFTFNIHGFNQ